MTSKRTARGRRMWTRDVPALTLGTLLAMGMVGAQPAPDAATPAKRRAARTPAVKGTTHLRVLHAIPAAPNVDVYLDGAPTLTDVAFKSLSDYMPISSGKHLLKVTATGQTSALLEASRSFAKDKFFTIAAYGTPEKPLLLVQNESTGQPAPDKTRLYVFHVAPGAPDVDITTPSQRNAKGYTSLVKALSFGKVKSKTMTAQSLTLQVRAGDKIVKEMPDVKLEAGKRYSAFALGKAGASGAEAFDLVIAAAAAPSKRE